MEDIEEEVQKTVPLSAASDPELEEKLLEVGGKLVEPPSSVEELLSLLDQLDSFLSRVGQSPSISMQNALYPSLKALIADELLRHSDADVKVAVASCISEVTRITAPEAPYGDDQMKEVFQLIISSFENLYDKTSRSYAKRISILETVAKVRSCVVMLDLECDAQILKMFQHFLKEIREHHPDNVFTSMEIIMTLVLEESEDISLELLSPLLNSVKKDSEEVFPIAKKLGVRVLESCATKLKPYLLQAVKSLGISLDDYSTILASICQCASDSLEQNGICVTREQMEDESKLAKQSLEESKQDKTEVVPSHQDIMVRCISPKSVMTNGVAKIGEDFCLADSKSLKRQEDTDSSDKSNDVNVSGYEEPNGLYTKKVDKREQKPEHTTRKRGRKSNSSTKLVEPFEGQVVANEKEAEKMLDSENHSEEVPNSLHEDASVEAAGPSENDKEINAKISSPKAGLDESEFIGSSPAEGPHDRNSSKKIGCAKTKDVHAKEVAAEDVSKVNDVTSDYEVKPAKQSVKKALGRKSDVKKISVVDSVKKESATTSDTDAKKQSAKKSDKSNKGDGGSSTRQPEEKKKSGWGKASFEKGVAKSSAKDVDAEMMSSPGSGTKSTKNERLVETSKTSVKRKHSSQTGNESDIMEYGENLVGLQIEVWWPDDCEFYKGVIDSFDPANKKHKVNYDDGEVEILRLRNEKWKIIKPADSDLDGDAGSDCASHDGSADMAPRKKRKTSAGDSTKQRKIDASSKSAREKAFSKSKGSSTKSSGKSKDGRKSKDSLTKSNFDDEEPGRKFKDNTPRSVGSKSIAAAQKMTGKWKNTDAAKTSKSKDDDISTPKPLKSKEENPKSGKSKHETLKTVA